VGVQEAALGGSALVSRAGKGTTMTEPEHDEARRDILPIPDVAHVGLTTYDAKDPDTSYPPIKDVRPPATAPNVLVILIDDVGFGASPRPPPPLPDTPQCFPTPRRRCR
jgi:hypothetical protein